MNSANDHQQSKATYSKTSISPGQPALASETANGFYDQPKQTKPRFNRLSQAERWPGYIKPLASNRPVLRYGIAVVAVTGAALLKFLQNWLVNNSANSTVTSTTPFITFYLAVVAAAWFGGGMSGVLATILSVLVSTFLFIQPTFSFAITGPEMVSNLVLFIIEGFLIGLLGQRLQQALYRAWQEVARNTQLAETIEAQHARFEVTLSSIGDAVIATDNQNRVTFMNEIAAQLTGWTVKEALGQDLNLVFNIVNDITRQTVPSPVTEVIKQGVIVGLANHTILISKDGLETAIEDSAAPIREAQGQIGGVVLVFRDVSDQRRRENDQQYLEKTTLALNASLDYEYTLNQVAQLTVPTIADWCSVYLPKIDPESGKPSIEQVAVGHIDPAKAEMARDLRKRFPLNVEDQTGVPGVLRSGQPEIVNQIDLTKIEVGPDLREPLDALIQLGINSWITVPMIARGQIIGAINLVLATNQRKFRQTDLKLAQELAGRAALAVDNARLYQAETHSRQTAEAAQRRLTFLADADEILFASLDYHETLSRLARLTIPQLADYCVIDILEESPDKPAGVQRVALAHRDPQKEQMMNDIQRRYPPDPANPIGISQAMRSGKTEIVTAIEQASLHRFSKDETHFEVLRTLAPESGISVPMIIRNPVAPANSASENRIAPTRVIGVMSLAYSGSGRSYTPQDIELAEELASRASIAVENARLYRQAREAIGLRNEFLSVAAHELKTPITSLKGHSQLITRQLERQGHVDPERLKRAFDVINQQSSKLSSLVNQLLDISRLEAGKMVLERSQIELVNFVTAIIDNAQTTLSNPDKHQLTLEADPGPLNIEVDEVRFEQAITNLLTNAIKYSPEGGSVRVEIKVINNPTNPTNPISRRTVQVSVTDQGIGIPPENREHIFERFYQAHSADYTSGMGLGLYISQQIIDLHGGRIWAEFPPEGGSRFMISLPGLIKD